MPIFTLKGQEMSPHNKLTALDTLRQAGVILAADGAQYDLISEFRPTDATTNPSLVCAATLSTQYEHHLIEAVDYAVNESSDLTVTQRTELAMDVLLLQFAIQILDRIPGRVSISVDPRLFLPFTLSPLDASTFDRALGRCLRVYSLADRILSSASPAPSRSRLLLKIPATPLGIAVAATLEKQHSIHTNLTLVFSTIQALACAQAGVSVISPFVGRVKDYHESRGFSMPKNSDGSVDMSQHPGIQLVRNIKTAFIADGHAGKTQIMACGFRSADEIIELCRTGSQGGPDLVTVQPELLAALRDQPAFSISPLDLVSPTSFNNSYQYYSPTGPSAGSLALFVSHLEAEDIAPIKVPEGLSKFAADTDRLEVEIRSRVEREQTRCQPGGFPQPSSKDPSHGLLVGAMCRMVDFWNGIFGYTV